MLISLVWKIILQASQQYQLTWEGCVFLCIYQSLDRTVEWVFEQFFIIYICWSRSGNNGMWTLMKRSMNLQQGSKMHCILYVLQVKVGAWELGRHMLVLWKSGWWKEGVMMDGRPIPRWDLENPSWTARGLPLQVTFHWFCEQDFSSQCWWDVSCLLALCHMLGIWAMLS